MSSSFAAASALHLHDVHATKRQSSSRGLFRKKDVLVDVLSPESVAVEFIDSKAGITNAEERRRIARREQRRHGGVASPIQEEDAASPKCTSQ